MSHLSICDSVNLSDVTSAITSAAKTRSFLYSRSGCTPWNSAFFPPNFSPPWFKLLKVLDMGSVDFTTYPGEIEQLILLRKMVKLRHIRLTGEGINKIGMQYPHEQYPFLLDNLQNLSWVDPWSCRDLLFGTPNIKKLGFRGQLIDGGCLSFPHLSFLNHLQELKLFNTVHNCSSNSLKSIQFPPNLKKLTLKKTNLKWDVMSTLVKEIKEEQESMGNNWLQILIRTTNLEALIGCNYNLRSMDTSMEEACC
ncbi:hypothetical protein LOK49_LG11G00408, partial [Camellia lanceoleosa]